MYLMISSDKTGRKDSKRLILRMCDMLVVLAHVSEYISYKTSYLREVMHCDLPIPTLLLRIVSYFIGGWCDLLRGLHSYCDMLITTWQITMTCELRI